MSTDSPAPRPSVLSDEQIEDALSASLSPLARLALAYAPKPHRMATLGLFALDARLANLLRHSKEPMLAQLRLSWWRETLGQDREAWPGGEPLLAAMRHWDGDHRGAIALVDGWEALTRPAPLAPEALLAMAQGRGDAFAAFARCVGCAPHEEAARRMGLAWGLTDLSVRLRNAEERAHVAALIELGHGAGTGAVPRALRPLKVLEVLSARRHAKGSEEAARSPRAVLLALRVGLLGR
ncbi:hypothetical protein MTR62_01720 [Novosphingobium sp. 1949]|uniref:Phytoene synthase n=1 Tax=Novosphingobium organovorum TaxID=2930092 RepID=A0ABT0B8M3_9SPHN|nr:hypothetical protein [Novosphingobium organovorum]MCJ2181430.1 hypothetical protein [Novosphingobium organovorum]